MSVYSKKGKGWRCDFTQNGTRYTEAWFKTKVEARIAEAEKRKELQNPTPGGNPNPPVVQVPVPEAENRMKALTETDMAFLDLINMRLDHVKAYNSGRHYSDHIYMARRWVRLWGEMGVSAVSTEKIQAYLIRRAKETSGYTANKELRLLRALFNFGTHPGRRLVKENPTIGIGFFPVERKVKYVPPKEDVLKVIGVADPEMQDYLWTLALTMGRMTEINRLTWDDVDLKRGCILLYTRKKRGGHLPPEGCRSPSGSLTFFPEGTRPGTGPNHGFSGIGTGVQRRTGWRRAPTSIARRS